MGEERMVLSRRHLLMGMGVGAATMMAGLAGCSAAEPKGPAAGGQEGASSVLKEATETVEADVVVVGSGIAGMSAAITAAEEGARVVQLEKQSILGGGSNFAEGVFGMGSDLQKEAGVTGDLADLLAIEMEFQKYKVDYTLWKGVLDGAEENLLWLIDQGVEFVGLNEAIYGNLRTQHLYKDHRGSTMIAKLEESARAAGVDIRLSTPAKRLIMENDAVVGVQAESGKDVVNVMAKAVILATGSSGSNWDLFDEHTSRSSKHYMWCGAQGIEGDGIKMAMEAGMGKCYRLMAPIVGTTVEPLGLTSQLAALGACNPIALWVNQDGVRYMDEGQVRKVITAPNALDTQIVSYSIVDQDLFDTLVEHGDPNVGWGFYVPRGTALSEAPAELDRELERGTDTIFKADSLAQLAEQLSIDPAVLQSTVDEYNEIVDAQVDAIHRKDPKYLTHQVATPPFYAFHVVGSNVNMFGGIHINSECEVIREDGSTIEGLYAAGLECGGFQGETYGISIPSSCQGIGLSTGRRSAKNAAWRARS